MITLSLIGIFLVLILVALLMARHIDKNSCNNKMRNIFAAVLSILGVYVFSCFITFNTGTKLSPYGFSKGIVASNYTHLVFDDETDQIINPGIDVIWYNHIIAPLDMNISSSVRPITENPKVRKLTYVIRVEIDPRHYFDDSQNSEEKENKAVSAAKKIKYWLYEFNNENSKKLAEFYNPLDPWQVSQLSVMVRSYLNQPERLGKYLEVVKVVSFEVT